MYGNVVLKNLAWSFLQDALFNILGIVFYLYLARVLGESGLGTYAYVLAVANFLNVILDLGLTNSFWRKWATDISSLSEDLGHLMNARLFLIFVASILTLPFLFWQDRAFFPYLLLVYGSSLFDSIRSISLSFLRARNSFHKVFLITAVERVTSLGGGLALLFLGYGLFSIFLLLFFSQLLSMVISLFVFPLPLPRRDFSRFRSLFQAGFPIFMIGFLTSSYQKIDAIFIRFIVGIEKLGTYTAAYRILDTLLILPSIILLAFLPTLAQLYAQQDEKTLQSLLSLAMKYLVIISGFIALFFQFYAPEILHFLYGAEFIESSNVLKILGWSLIFFFVSAPLYAAVVASKKDTFMIKRLLVLNGMNILGNIFLLSRFGIIVAATMTLTTEVIGFILLYRMLSLSANMFSWLWKVFLSLFVLGAALFFFHLALFPTLLLSGSLYLVLLLALRAIQPEEIPLLRKKNVAV